MNTRTYLLLLSASLLGATTPVMAAGLNPGINLDRRSLKDDGFVLTNKHLGYGASAGLGLGGSYLLYSLFNSKEKRKEFREALRQKNKAKRVFNSHNARIAIGILMLAAAAKVGTKTHALPTGYFRLEPFQETLHQVLQPIQEARAAYLKTEIDKLSPEQVENLAQNEDTFKQWITTTLNLAETTPQQRMLTAQANLIEAELTERAAAHQFLPLPDNVAKSTFYTRTVEALLSRVPADKQEKILSKFKSMSPAFSRIATSAALRKANKERSVAAIKAGVKALLELHTAQPHATIEPYKKDDLPQPQNNAAQKLIETIDGLSWIHRKRLATERAQLVTTFPSAAKAVA